MAGETKTEAGEIVVKVVKSRKFPRVEPLRAWWSSATPFQRARLAKSLETSEAYLYQIANGYRQASAMFAKRLDRAFRTRDRSVNTYTIRPDIWSKPRGQARVSSRG